MLQHHITLDMEWSSDETIQYVWDIIRQAGRKTTWFATHKSEAVNELEGHENVEIGIHPNFMMGSTHGNSEKAVLSHLKKLFPKARCMRTHCLYQNTRMFDLAACDFDIAIDVSLLLPFHSDLKILPAMRLPCGKTITRIPYFWEDDVEMMASKKLFSTDDERLHCPGIKVYDFHPIYIAMNFRSLDDYRELAAQTPIHQWDRKFILKNQRPGKGVLHFFEELLMNIREEKTMSELAEGV